MQPTVTVLDIPIAAITMDQAVTTVERYIKGERPCLIATANAEMVMMSRGDKELAVILQSADLVVPDGAGVVWATRHQGRPIPERVTGYDLAQRLLALASIKGYRVYFLGAAPGVAEQARKAAQKRYPGINIVGVRDGYFQTQDDASIINAIHAAEPHILFAALGVPKQEKWLAKHRAGLGVPVAMGVGGTFDVMAGIVDRAPLWMQHASLEWLFRLAKQPQRFIRVLALPRFVLNVMLTKKRLDKA